MNHLILPLHAAAARCLRLQLSSGVSGGRIAGLLFIPLLSKQIGYVKKLAALGALAHFLPGKRNGMPLRTLRHEQQAFVV